MNLCQDDGLENMEFFLLCKLQRRVKILVQTSFMEPRPSILGVLVEYYAQLSVSAHM